LFHPREWLQVRKMENGESSWKDRLGIAASALCAVHCAATPILLACLPTLQFTEWMASPEFHQIAAIICVSLVSISIWPAFHRHRDYRVLGLSTTGLALILGAAFLLPDSCCSTDAGTANAPFAATKTHDHAGHDHAGHDHAGHDHAGHDHAGDSETASSDLALAGFVSAFFAKVQPWMTPFGGLLLIAAHFLNLRRGLRICQSRCDCEEMPVAVAELTASQAA
jgi:MerC mercury resistance protein